MKEKRNAVDSQLHRQQKRRRTDVADEQKQQRRDGDDSTAESASDGIVGRGDDAHVVVMDASSSAVSNSAAAHADNDRANPSQIGHCHSNSRRRRLTTTTTVDYPLLVQHVSTFLNDWSSSSTAATALSSMLPSTTDTISYLVNYLSNHGEKSANYDDLNNHNSNHENNVNITKSDVASILLPWSVSRLVARVQQQEEEEMESSRGAFSSLVEGGVSCDQDCSDEEDGEDEYDHPLDVDNDDTNNNKDDYVHLLEWSAFSLCLDVLNVTTDVPPSKTQSDDTYLLVAEKEGSSSILYSKEDKEDEGSSLISSNLSQSILNILLPRAVRTALTPTTFTTSTTASVRSRSSRMADAAANVYIHLVQKGKYYRPTTLEVACQTLLRLVDEYSMLHFQQQMKQVQLHHRRHHQRRWMVRITRVRNATLSMVRMLVDTATNHKRVFAALSSTYVLPILGRWAMNMSSTSATDNELRQQSAIMVGDILQKGLYNSDASLDGYRSAISHLDEEARNSGTVTTAPKNDKWNSYQSSLFTSIQNLVGSPTSLTCSAIPASTHLMQEHEEHHTKVVGRNDVIIAVVGILPLITRGFFDRVLLPRKNHQQGMTSNQGGTLLSTSIEGDAILQFRFWRHIISPVVDELSSLLAEDNTKSLSLMESNHHLRALLGAISETLCLVLKYDAYSASYTDINGENVSFLERITDCLLRVCSRTRPMRHNDVGCVHVGDDGIVEALTLIALHCILSLNHRLLHERLADVIYFACYCLQSSSLSSSSAPLHPQDTTDDDPASLRTKKTKSTGELANDILSVIVKTYRELRQTGYFLASIRGAFVSTPTNASRRNDDDMLLLRLGSCTDVAEVLTLAYQTCPSGQIAEIWNFFNDWIFDKKGKSGIGGESVKSTSCSNDRVNLITCEASSCMKEHEFAVQMFIMFIQNIRADKHNAAELRGLCEATLSTSVSMLLIGNRGNIKVLSHFDTGGLARLDREMLLRLRHGFDLCGWLVDLHTRCCFWMDGADTHIESGGSAFLLSQSENDCSSDVLSLLNKVANTTLSTQRFKLWRSTWITKYWQSRAKGSSRKIFCPEELCNIDISASLHGSLQRLALHRIHQLHSMIYYCNIQESELRFSEKKLNVSNASCLSLTNEAKMLVDFSIYLACSHTSLVDESSSESLWTPMAQSLCIWSHYSDSFHVELFLIWFFAALCERHCLEDQVLRLEKTTALTLARDASFYDIGNVMSLFMQIGVQFAASRLLDSIVTSGISCKMEILDVDSGATKLCKELAEREETRLARDNDLDVVSTTLAFLASAPIDLTLCNENVKLIDRIVGLDVLSSQLFNRGMDSPELNSLQILNIIRSNMNILSNLLPKALLLSSDFNAPCLANLARHLFSNCLQFRSDDDVVFASCNAVSEYFTLCIDYFEMNPSILAGLFTKLESLIRDGDIDFSPKATVLRSVIRRMNILDRHHSLSKNTSKTNPSIYKLCFQFVLETQTVLHYTDFEFISKAGIDRGNDTVAAKALLLESEVWSFIGSHIEGTPDSILITNDQVENALMCVGNLFRSISRAQESSCRLVFTNAVDYFLSAMSVAPDFFLQCVPASDLVVKVLEALAQSLERKKEGTGLDAALCSLVRAPGSQQTKTAVQHLLSKSKGCNRADSVFVTKAFHLLITCANNHEQKHLSDSCKEFLLIVTGLLRDRQCASVELAPRVKLFSNTLTTLISKKELLLLTGREISMICCEMNPILVDARVNKHLANDDSVSIFSSCCSVIAALISHYPKQLYGCPSPLFSLMLALLSNVLRTSVKSGASHKAKEYAKVCELLIPHKDILKKHVVGLIIHYIWTLKRGLNPTLKSKLMPAIFALLDMLSDFETRQINAMIDAPSKALFAPIFRSYQKVYQYHGQA